MSQTITGAAAKPTSNLTTPTPGGDTDTWGTILADTTLLTLLNNILWLLERVKHPEIEINQVAHGLAVGNLARHDGSAWVQSLADTAAHAVTVGMVSAVPDVDNFTIAFAGEVTGLSGLTAGTVYYLQNDGSLNTTPGTITVAALLATSTTGGILLFR